MAAARVGHPERRRARALADYKVPKHIEIAPNLPREDSGKIFKRLRDPYWERAGPTI
jgi:long-chain acyl-CoA synthetase